jgi:phage shock protein PspC (stress-responsive transcriptional regulator)
MDIHRRRAERMKDQTMHEAQIAIQDDAPAAESAPAAAGPAEERQPNLFFRNDTIMGVCEAIGQDFGFHPNWLRVALALGLFWNATYVIAGYLAAGVVVAVSRWIFPDVRVAAADPAKAADPANTNEESLPLAA